MKYKPIRMCIVCRERFVKSELERYIITDEFKNALSFTADSMAIDIQKNINTRGYYLCNKSSCREKFQKLRLKNRKSKKA